MSENLKISYCFKEEKRIDLFLAKKVQTFSRSMIQKLIREGFVKVNGNDKIRTSYKLKYGDFVEIEVPPNREIDLTPENIPLKIIYEDKDIIVVDKKRGMVVHPGAGVYSGTLVNALLYHCKDLSGIGGVVRPGIVHRLDKGTSGIIVVAKNDSAHEKLSRAFADRKIKKTYKAIVMGSVNWEKKSIETYIGRHPKYRKKMAVIDNGKLSISHFRLLGIGNEISYLEVKPDTGRTHQIRVHSKYLGHCILGDFFYCPNQKKKLKNNNLLNQIKNLDGFCLHASQLEIIHPIKEKEMVFNVHLPSDMKGILEVSKVEVLEDKL